MHSPFRHLGAAFRKRTIQLTFFLTRRCNAQCPFCFYLKSDAPPKNGPELSLYEIREVSASLGRLLWVAFSGGEIYLRGDLAEIAGTFYATNRPAIMLFPTNGMLPGVIREQTEQILRDCPDSVIAVKLSLDGTGEDHDRFRNTPGSFAKTMETYRLLAPLVDRYPHFELGVNTVFAAGNQDAMEEIITFVKGLREVRTHTISLVRGRLADCRHAEVDKAKYRRAVNLLEQGLRDRTLPRYRFRGARIKAAQDILQRRLIHQTMEENRGLIPCFAGRLNLVLSERGDVSPCEIREEAFGNVRDHGYDLKRVLRTPAAREVLSSIRSGQCHCTHECYFMTNILFNPALYPAIAREYLRL